MPDPKPNLRHVIDSAVGSVLWNVSNYPERVQARLLGQDTAPLRDKVVDAVLAVVEPTTNAREVEWEYGVEWSRQRGAAYETTWTGWAWQDDLAGAQRSAASKLDGRVLRRRAPGPTEYAPDALDLSRDRTRPVDVSISGPGSNTTVEYAYPEEVRRLSAKIIARERPLLDRLAAHDGPEEDNRG